MHWPLKHPLRFSPGGSGRAGDRSQQVSVKGTALPASGSVPGSAPAAAMGTPWPPLPPPAPSADPAGAGRVPGCNGRRQGCSWEPHGSFPYPTTAAAS